MVYIGGLWDKMNVVFFRCGHFVYEGQVAIGFRGLASICGFEGVAIPC